MPLDNSAVWCYHPSIGNDGDGLRMQSDQREAPSAGRASETGAAPTTPEPDGETSRPDPRPLPRDLSETQGGTV